MINVCIYCGKNKLEALEACESCFRSPNSHIDSIHSIVLCFSETEPYLNFLSLEEIEEIRDEIIDGASIDIKSEIFNRAEEAYRAVMSNSGPMVMQYFANISFPIISVVLITILAIIFI
jgi:hypothetical protein